MSNASVLLCTGGYDHTVQFWEATSGKCYRTLQFNESQINCLEITPDKQVLAVAGHPHIKLFDINHTMPHPVLNCEGHTNNVTSIGFHKDRKWMFSASEDGTVKIWDPRAGGSYQRDYQSKAPINTVVLHPNQGEIISGDEDGRIYVWDLTANRCQYELIPDGKTAIRSLTIASDASMLVAANNKGIVFSWRLESKQSYEPFQKIEAHHTFCLKTLLSPDVKYLATTSSDKTIKIWNVDNKGFTLSQTLTGHRRWVWDCEFSADSAYLVSASSDTTARLWDLKSGESIIEYSGHHSKALTCVALNDSSE